MHKKRDNTLTGLEIAVIGMAGRFPGAGTIEEFWENLKNGKESITFFSDEELKEMGIESQLLENPNYIKARGFIEDIEYFDASFFNYSPREAEIMDPQIRVLHECSWWALEDAGYDSGSYKGKIGFYVGAAANFNWVSLSPLSRGSFDAEGLEAATLCFKDSIGTLTAYKLNLKGPAVTLYTACSTSLVALHLACRALLTGECGIALAGGVSISYPKKHGYLYHEAMILSTDGHCRPFDAGAGGTVFGDGVGVVVLKPLSRVLQQEGDHIYAVVKATAINNDGERKVGYTAPSVEGQTEVVRAALHMAEFDIESIGYIETHGTGTKIGDPIEIQALKQVFNTGKKGYCGIGTVKSNLGHLDTAAGIAGFIKTVLALKERLIPPTLNFESPNPGIDFLDSAFYVNAALLQWRNPVYPLRAGVSAFGLGGTNAHVILEEWPDDRGQKTEDRGQEIGDYQLILLSAKTRSALDQMARNLVEYFTRNPGINLADAAYTLQVGRREFEYRRMVLCSNLPEAIAGLKNNRPIETGETYSYETNGEELRLVFMFPGAGGAGSGYVSLVRELYEKEPLFREEIDNCFKIIGYDSSAVLYPGESASPPGASPEEIEHSGIAPPLLLVFQYALAVLLVKWGSQPTAVLGQGVGQYIAAVFSGELTLEEALKSAAGKTRESNGLAKGFGNQAEQLNKRIKELAAIEGVLFLEIGPAGELAGLAASVLPHSAGRVLGIIKKDREGKDDLWFFLSRLGRLWCQGAAVAWKRFHSAGKRNRISLPGYPFQGKRYWIDAPPPGEETNRLLQPLGKKEDIADWFYSPQWEEVPFSPSTGTAAEKNTWLIFVDECGIGDPLVNRLQKQGSRVVVVKQDLEFNQVRENRYRLNPREIDHYSQLLEELNRGDKFPAYIVHMWNLTEDKQGKKEGERILESGFYSLVHLSRAIARQGVISELRMVIVTSNMHNVTGSELICPEKSMVLAPCQSLPQEIPNISCKSIDILIPASKPGKETIVLQLLKECNGGTPDMVVAFREGQRWVRKYKPLSRELLSGALSLETSQAVPQLRAKGVYLIIGGLGGIGIKLAEYLAKAVGARLALTGRRGLPQVKEWDRWLAQHDEDDETSTKIRKIRDIKALGAEVEVFAADAADKEQMEQVICRLEQTFGPVNGIIHAAGILHRKSAFCILEKLDRALCVEHFRAKLAGTGVLEALLQDRPNHRLDFCILISSLSPILGGLGFTAYAAANLFMDAYVNKHNLTKPGPWTCVNWGDWQDTVKRNRDTLFKASLERLEMTPGEGIRTFQCVLSLAGKGMQQVVISAGDLQTRIDQWIRPGVLKQGKIDRKLPQAKPEQGKISIPWDQDLAPGLPGNINLREEIEELVTRTWLEFYRVDQVEADDNFFQLGATSLDLLQVHGKLVKALKKHIPFDIMFEYPTIRQLAGYLSGEQDSNIEEFAWLNPGAREANSGEVAVIGMAGRFPGAENLDQFWDNLKNGVESIFYFSDQELAEAGIDSQESADDGYIKAKGFLADTEYFDSSFFDYTPTDAEIMDPQVRIFHECVWEALEDAGYNPKNYQGAIALYAGATPNLYWEVLAQLSRANDAAGQFGASLMYDKDSLSTQVSYKLDLKGPSITIFTGCSTSLVAVNSAYQALTAGQCDMALAGGVTVTLPERSGYTYQPGMLFSSDGHCRTFDARASGMVFGDGVGVVLLKPLKNALADRDNIHAVIKGAAVDNDGSKKVGYTSPGVKGQVEVVKMALHMSGVQPETISYVETHGTGTRLGDLIEIKALTQAFNTDKKGFCRIGSVKTNIGHTMCASGTAGLIKTVFSLKHRLIPPSLNFEIQNPEIDFAHSPFVINSRLHQWESNGSPLRAGVSSFGIGGTNAHLVLEEAPGGQSPGTVSGGTRGLAPLPTHQHTREYQLILLSAKTQSALDKMTENLAEYFKKNLLNGGSHENPTTPGPTLADAAYTLQVGRRVFNYRRTLVCSNADEAARSLSTADPVKVKTILAKKDRNKIVFMFPGHGAQYVNMGLELYEKEPVFRREADQCFEILKPIMGYDIKEVLYPLSRSDKSGSSDISNRSDTSYNINQTEIAQPVIFLFEYALAKLLMQWGIRPSALIGYSFGEFAAAHFSGVFSLEDALKLIALRGKLTGRLPLGAMLSVPLAMDPLKELLQDFSSPIFPAIDNGDSCIVSGSEESIGKFEKYMKARKYICMRVAISHAAHSPEMKTLHKEFEKAVKGVTLNKPEIPYISNITGTWITPRQAARPGYWGRHMMETVRFAAGMKELIKEKDFIFLEVGPGRDLSVMAHRFLEDEPERILNTVRPQNKDMPDTCYLLTQVARLWSLGIKIDWQGFYKGEKRHRISLPTYSFARQRYRIEGNPYRWGAEKVEGSGSGKKKDIADWFYPLTWQRSGLPPVKIENIDIDEKSCWLVFINPGSCPFSHCLWERLQKENHHVVRVTYGAAFSESGGSEYSIDPRESSHYNRLLESLQSHGKIPQRVLHLWSVSTGKQDNALFTPHDLGFFSLLFLTKAVGKQNITEKLQFLVLSNNMQEVAGEGLEYPEKATLIGPCRVIPREYPNITCRSIDVALPGPGSEPGEKLIESLMAEFNSPSPDMMVAYRGNCRWVQTFAPVRLNDAAVPGPRLKQKGVYLITGGMGGIGFELARHLARVVQARLVLIGRSSFPDRSQWESWLASHSNQDPTSRKILEIKTLEARGAKIMVFTSDVTDRERMGQVIARADKRLGDINGVIHAAGVAGGGMIQLKTREIAAGVFAPKIKGTLVLNDIFQGRKLDFFVVCSSTASILGLFGQVDYTGANAFLDAFAFHKTSKDGTFTVSINWYDWQEVGMAVEAARQYEGRMKISLEDGILPAEGAEAFTRIVAGVYPQVVVAPKDIEVLVEESDTTRRIEGRLEQLHERREPSTLHPRPELDVAYAAPRSEWERVLADIIQEIIGIDRPGIYDDFFELGGDSLKAITVLSKIHKELQVEISLQEFFQKPTIEQLACFVAGKEKSRYFSIKAVEKKEYYPLSSAQTRLYIMYRIDPSGTAYNESFAVLLQGILDRDQLNKAVKQLIKRHESFRTTFEIIDNKPVQRIHNEAEFEIEYYDLQVTGAGDRCRWEEAPFGQASDAPGEKTQTGTETHHSFIRPFDLSRAPLLRVGVIEEADNRRILMIDMHHIITDGVSDNIFVKDFMALYSGEVMPSLKIQYKDYAQWQCSASKQEVTAKQENYWLNQFKGQLPVLDFPTDYGRPLLQNFEGSSISSSIDKELTGKVKAFVSENDTTLYIILLAVYTILLSKYTGREDIVVGSPITGRTHPDLQNIIGMFVNMLAMRNFPVGSMRFAEFLEKVKKNSLQAFENQEYQFEELVTKLGLQGETSRNPLFDVVFALQNMGVEKVEINDLKVVPYESENKGAQFDFLLITSERENTIDITLEYSTALFKKETTERLVERYIEILKQVTEEKDIKLQEIRFSHDLIDITTVYQEEEEEDFGF
ncbi:MAG: SDR family NAD(P)-dependent oxidoreductase [Candidatus Aminicenantes bacterium]